MTYETMNWEAEAKRLERAFELKAGCYFEESLDDNHEVKSGLGNVQTLRWDGDDELYFASEKVTFWCLYHREWGASYWFNRVTDGQSVEVNFGWDGKPRIYAESAEITPLIAKPLFYLGLLTPEVEAALGVVISSHQKVEWMLEFERS